MKHILAIVVLLLAGCATTTKSEFIRTSGEGNTFEQAKLAAFREAIQIKVGAVVLSERLHNVEKTVQDDITVHSSGYVDEYKVINTSNINGTYRVTVDVLVAESKLANQILTTAKSEKNFAGDRATNAYSTYVNQANDADKLISRVLSGYPRHAFVLEQGHYMLGVDQFRTGKLVIPFKVRWSKDYLTAVDEIVKRYEDKRGAMNRIMYKPMNIVEFHAKNDNYFSKNSKYEIVDQRLLNTIVNSMYGVNEARIRADVYDGNHNSMYTTCVVPWWRNQGRQFFSSDAYNNITFDGNIEKSGKLTLPVTNDNLVMYSRAVSIELSIVALKDCPRER
jgi:hypothetical protein